MRAEEFIVNLFTYISNYDATDSSSVRHLSFNNKNFHTLVQPFFEITTSHSKVVSRSQIIDGEEVFERMSVKATEIDIRGTILVDQWKQYGFQNLGRGAVQIATDTQDWNNAYKQREMLDAIDIVNRQVYKPNETIQVENPYLNQMGIEYILIISMNTSPLVGSVGFEFSIKALDATNKKDNLKQTLIISQ